MPAIYVGEERIGIDSSVLFGALLRLGCNDGTPIDRGVLAACLWPTAPSAYARRQSMRQLLYRARKMGIDLESSATDVAISRETVEVDTRRRLAQGIASLNATELQVLAGGVLNGFEPKWSRPLLEWVEQLRDEETASIRRELVAALLALEGLPHWTRIEHVARALQKLDPYSRMAAAALIAVHQQRGEHEEAQREAESFEAEIPSDTEGPTVRELAKRWVKLPSTQLPAEHPTTLHGRAEEIEMLAALVRSAATRKGGTCILTGAGGIGKTRLLKEAAGIAHRFGLRTIVRSVEPSGFLRPLGVWQALARDVVKLPGAIGASPEAIAVCESSGSATPTPSPETIAAAIGDVLCAVADERPILVAIDDLEQAGSVADSALLVLARTVSKARVVLVFAGRFADTDPPAIPDALVLRLGALDDSATRALVSELATLRRLHVSTLATEKCVALAGGLPLFAEELIGLLSDERSPDPLTQSLDETVRKRVFALPEDPQAILPLVAALGPLSSVERLQKLAGWASLRLIRAIDSLERHGFLGGDKSSPRVRHALIENAVLRTLAPTARSALHRSIVNLLFEDPETSSRPESLVACAHHLYLAGAHEDAAAVAAGVVAAAHQDGMSELFSRVLEIATATKSQDAGRRIVRELVELAATSGNNSQGLQAISALASRPNSPAAAHAMVRELGPSSIEVFKRTASEWRDLVASTVAALADEHLPSADRLDAAVVGMVLGADMADPDFMHAVSGMMNSAGLAEDDNPDAFLRSKVIFHTTCGSIDEALLHSDRLVLRTADLPDRARHSRALTYAARVARIAGRYDTAMQLHHQAYCVAKVSNFATRALGAAIEGTFSALQAESRHDAEEWLERALACEPLSRDINYSTTLLGVRVRCSLLLGVGSLPSAKDLGTFRSRLQEKQTRPRAQLLADLVLMNLASGTPIPSQVVERLYADSRKLSPQSDVDAVVAAATGALRNAQRGDDAEELSRFYASVRRDSLPLPSYVKALSFTA